MNTKNDNNLMIVLNRSVKILTLIFAVITICIALTNFIYIKSTVIGESMYSTLHTDDIVYINRLMKGEKGDIVVCEKPNNLSTEETFIIKRLIATTGDTVSFKYEKEEKVIYLLVNSVKIQSYKLDDNEDLTGIQTFCQYSNYVQQMYFSNNTERVENVSKFYYIDSKMNQTIFYTGDIKLFDKEIYVLGDNWKGSTDSSYYGPISCDSLIGRVDIILKSNNSGVFALAKELIKFYI